MGYQTFIKDRLWPFLAGLGSAAVMVLAFFIPSLQDQYDRYQSRKIITQYVILGDEFFTEGRYDMAENAYQKAYEYADSKRLDIEVKRLKARVNRVNMDPKWGAAVPEDLEEIDFQYLLHLQQGKDNIKERTLTLNSYGIFLASKHEYRKAAAAFDEAITIDSTNAIGYINRANLYDQQGKKKEAEQNYKKAALLDKESIDAWYNLALLHREAGRLQEAKTEMENAWKLDTLDEEVKKQYQQILDEIEQQ